MVKISTILILKNTFPSLCRPLIYRQSCLIMSLDSIVTSHVLFFSLLTLFLMLSSLVLFCKLNLSNYVLYNIFNSQEKVHFFLIQIKCENFHFSTNVMISCPSTLIWMTNLKKIKSVAYSSQGEPRRSTRLLQLTDLVV